MTEPDAALPLLTISELAPLIERRVVSPVEVVDQLLERIGRLDPTLRAFITLTADEARDQARAAEVRIRRGGYLGPLDGIPIAHKDVFWTRGLPTTAHSRVLWDFVPRQDAAVVERLRAVGAISLGKLNTYEFANGATPIIGASVNPWDLRRSTGGSSCGSAAAVAARLCYAATGSDTGGSIRSPAAYCGVVGVKPTYGRVSRYGLIPFSWSLDHPGVLARSAQDAALILTVIAGPDERDPASDTSPVPDYAVECEAASKTVGLLRIGVPDLAGLSDPDVEVLRVFERALLAIRGMVATIVPIVLPSSDLVNAAYYGIRAPEATLFHRQWLREAPEKYDPFTRRKALVGACLSADDYLEAQQMRRVLRDAVGALFANAELLVWPTTSRTAFRLDEAELPVGIGSELMNLAGYPSISVPCGFTAAGLPVGIQITGRPRAEGTVLGFAASYARLAPLQFPDVDPGSEPQPTRPYTLPILPEQTTAERLAVARDDVRAAFARNGFQVSEEDEEHVAIALCGYREVQRAARTADCSSVEPTVHQLPL